MFFKNNLWGHVPHGPTFLVLNSLTIQIKFLRKPEVTYFGYWVVVFDLRSHHEYVIKLDVSMDHALRVNVSKALQYIVSKILEFAVVFYFSVSLLIRSNKKLPLESFRLSSRACLRTQGTGRSSPSSLSSDRVIGC